MILHFEHSIYLDYSQDFVKKQQPFLQKGNKKESWIYTMAFCSDYVDRVSGSGCRHTKVIEVVTDHSLVSTATFPPTGSFKQSTACVIVPFRI